MQSVLHSVIYTLRLGLDNAEIVFSFVQEHVNLCSDALKTKVILIGKPFAYKYISLLNVHMCMSVLFLYAVSVVIPSQFKDINSYIMCK
jgi:hypothetical protein